MLGKSEFDVSRADDDSKPPAVPPPVLFVMCLGGCRHVSAVLWSQLLVATRSVVSFQLNFGSGSGMDDAINSSRNGIDA